MHHALLREGMGVRFYSESVCCWALRIQLCCRKHQQQQHYRCGTTAQRYAPSLVLAGKGEESWR